VVADYRLYGGELSLFTGKARAYLRYKGLNFEECAATRQVYRELIIPRVGAPIVPVLQTAAGDIVQDTTDIIDYLEARHPEAPVYPAGPCQRLAALLLELFGDEWLVIPAMHYRWSVLDQQRDFIYGEFGRTSDPQASREEQIAIGERISRPFSGMLPALGITPRTIPGIEATYLSLLDDLNAHLARYPFLLGSRPSIGDFGLMGPLYAHLGRDPVPRAIMQSRAPHVYAWVERMNAPAPCSGDFLGGDAVPASLLPILRLLCRDQLPDVLDVLQHNAAWLAQNPGGNLPRALGMHPFRFGEARGERLINSYAQWMFQRPWLHYHNLRGAARQAADQLLREIGGYEALQCNIERWVERRPGQLELVEGERPGQERPGQERPGQERPGRERPGQL